MKNETKNEYIAALDSLDGESKTEIRVDSEKLERLINQYIVPNERYSDIPVLTDKSANLLDRIDAINGYVFTEKYELLRETEKYVYHYRLVGLLDGMYKKDGGHYPYFIQLTRELKKDDDFDIDKLIIIADDQVFNTKKYLA